MKVWVHWSRGEISTVDPGAGTWQPYLLIEDGLLQGPLCLTHDCIYTDAEEELAEKWGEPPCVTVWRGPTQIEEK